MTSEPYQASLAIPQDSPYLENNAPDDGEVAHLLLDYAGANRSNAQECGGRKCAIVEATSATNTTTGTEEGAPVEQVAAAWVRHIEAGNQGPDSLTALQLLKAMLGSRTLQSPPSANQDVRLVQVDTGKKFPHMIDTMNDTLTGEEGVWTQCKTKMTHIAVRLINSRGEPVMGTQVQEGGLELKLTLHKVGNCGEPLDDNCNPRSREGLFLGRASKEFSPFTLLLESRFEFRFQVMLLSSDIGGSHMFIKIAPVHPSLAFNNNLTVLSRTFASRARMPDTNREGSWCTAEVSVPSPFLGQTSPPVMSSQHTLTDAIRSEAE